MLVDQNTYGAYTDNLLVGASPIQLIVALYEGAIAAVQQGKRCFELGDVMGRGAAVTKASSILSELIASLDMERGGEISQNLKKLYGYMLGRILGAHVQKDMAAFTEIEGLLMQLLEAWNTVASTPETLAALQETTTASALQTEDFGEPILEQEAQEPFVYPGYFLEAGASVLGQAYSF